MIVSRTITRSASNNPITARADIIHALGAVFLSARPVWIELFGYVAACPQNGQVIGSGSGRDGNNV